MKRMISLTLVLLFLMSAFCFSTHALSVIRGDADSDGKVTVIDATTIQKKLASITVGSFDRNAADVDGDGSVTILDANYIQKSLAHMEIPYGIGEVVTIEETDAPTQGQTEPATQMPTYKQGENELPFIPN